MSLNKTFLPEWMQETASTRKLLERIPLDKGDWKPHEKSMSLARLTGHLAELSGWVDITLMQDELDFSKMDYKPFIPASTAELLENFDKLTASATAILTNVTDETLMGNWTMRNGEQVYFTMPKMAVLRTWVFNHIIHHRAQLTVYLRMLDVPVPGMYGPTADES